MNQKETHAMRKLSILTSTLLVVLFASTSSVLAQSKTLRVFILAGQSNMEGHAKIETFDYIGDDPATAPLLKMMRGPDGKPAVAEGAWISYLTVDTTAARMAKELASSLQASARARDQPTKDGGKIGPEFTFGLTMDAAFEEPVLIIKTAWGGRSLNTSSARRARGHTNSARLSSHRCRNRGRTSPQKRKRRPKKQGVFTAT